MNRAGQYRASCPHVVNGIANADFILDVLISLGIAVPLTRDDVENALRECARKAISAVVRSQLTKLVNNALVSSIDLKFDPTSEAISMPLSDALRNSVRKIDQVIREMSIEELKKKESELSDQFNADLISGNWKTSLPGRVILRGFVGQHVKTISYIPFRNLVLSRMADARFQPPGIASVIAQITSA